MENAAEKLNPVMPSAGDITNLKHIKERPVIVCWSILLTDEMVARVASRAWLWTWLLLAI